jgi:exosome complex exonuclease DIS3/RRP44
MKELACRYADVLVHRCLAASLGLIPLPDALKDRDSMAEVISNMNDRHTNAQRAGRSSTQLYTHILFRKDPVIAEARVVKVQGNGLIVLVPKYGMEGPVYFDEGKNGGSGVTLNESKQVWNAVALAPLIFLLLEICCSSFHRSNPVSFQR